MRKMAFWSTKAAISLKRVTIEKKLLWGAYRNSSTLFRRVPIRPPTASSTPRLGVRNPTQNFNRYYLRNSRRVLYGYELQIWPIHSQGPSEQKPIKILEKWERGRNRGLPNVLNLKYPRLSQERVKLRTSNLADTFIVSI